MPPEKIAKAKTILDGLGRNARTLRAAGIKVVLLNPHRLDVAKLANPEFTQLAPVARILDAPKRQSWIGRHHAVDEHRAGLDLPDETRPLSLVLGPHT